MKIEEVVSVSFLPELVNFTIKVGERKLSRVEHRIMINVGKEVYKQSDNLALANYTMFCLYLEMTQ